MQIFIIQHHLEELTNMKEEKRKEFFKTRVNMSLSPRRITEYMQVCF